MLMKDTGVVADTVPNMETALKILQESSAEKFVYQLLLIDWNIVDAEGIELVREIRNCTPKEVPILFLAECDAEGLEEALAIDNTKILAKPFLYVLFRKRYWSFRQNIRKDVS